MFVELHSPQNKGLLLWGDFELRPAQAIAATWFHLREELSGPQADLGVIGSLAGSLCPLGKKVLCAYVAEAEVLFCSVLYTNWIK